MTAIHLVFLVFAALATITPAAKVGSLWPHPQQISSSTSTIQVARSLQFVSIGPINGSQILKKAFERYSHVIFDLDASFCPPAQQEAIETDLTAVAVHLSQFKVSVSSPDESLQLGIDESYTLSITPDRNSPSTTANATLVAKTVFGALRGLETFSQLVSCQQSNSFVLNGYPLSITDFPRFPHRGVLLDTSRHFYAVSDIKRTIDGLAYSKMNVLHWHVVDSQSFPIVSTSLPLLSLSGAYSPYEVYTPKDVADIVQYGYERGVRIIPEFDVPGHTTAWGLGYPNLTVCNDKEPWDNYCAEPPCGQLDPTREQTYALLATLFKEMTQKFMDNYFHLGSDEVNSNCWTSTPSIAEYMKHQGYTSVTPLVQLFENRAHQIIKSNNKTPINWEEVITEWDLNLDKNSLIQVWLGASSVVKVIQKGFKVIASPADYWYLDCGLGDWLGGGKSWCDPFKTWQRVYSYEPTANVSQQLQHFVIGGEVCIWSETIDPSNLDPMLWPRGGAAAERLWSAKTLTDPEAALPRFRQYRQVLLHRGIRAAPVQPEFCRLNPTQCPLS